jgi:hypothetical protein
LCSCQHSDVELFEMFHSPSNTCPLGAFVQECALRRSQTLSANVITPVAEECLRTEGMSVKKQHEVTRLSALIQDLAVKHNVRRLVDFGGGQGHLAKILADCLPGVRITVIDSNGDLLRKLVHPRIDTLNVFVDVSTVDSLLVQVGNEDTLLYSLHACGDLSDWMIRMHSKLPRSRVLVNVGCCYNRITQSSWHINELMAACQAPCCWLASRQNSEKAGWLNYYRAVLQAELSSASKLHLIDGRRFTNIKISATPSFDEYLCACNVDWQIEAGRLSMYSRTLYAAWWTARAALGMLIEAQILAARRDRLQGARLVCLFEESLSPRNHAIVHETE